MSNSDIKYTLLFMTKRVISGKIKFEDLPYQLKPGVYENLKKENKEYLAGDYKPPTAN